MYIGILCLFVTDYACRGMCSNYGTCTYDVNGALSVDCRLTIERIFMVQNNNNEKKQSKSKKLT